jgi:hypothetical protein
LIHHAVDRALPKTQRRVAVISSTTPHILRQWIKSHTRPALPAFRGRTPDREEPQPAAIHSGILLTMGASDGILNGN